MDKTLHTQLENALRQFTIDELSNYAINQIQDLNWDDILKKIRDMKRQLSRTKLVEVIIGAIKDLQLDDATIKDTTHNLNLLAVALSKTKTWQTYKLLNQNKKIPSTNADINKRLDYRFRSSNIRTEIHTIDHDGKFVLSISKIISPRKKSGVQRVDNPTFIIFQPTTEYIFTTKLLTSEPFNTALVRSLGYQNLKNIKLTGKKPTELLKLLVNKDTNRTRIAYEEPTYNPKIKKSGSVVDFTRSKEKTEYINEVYDENIGLESLTFHTRKPSASKEMKGEEIEATMTFMSPNIDNMIANLVAGGVIDTPLPVYLKQVLKHGKNVFNINRNE